MIGYEHHRALVAGSLLLGMGFGGFFDGIVLHQVLQWHHMLTSAGHSDATVAGLRVNTLWDGLFHVGTYLLTGAGVALLWRATGRAHGPLPGSVLAGGLLAGWGVFNLVEGVIDHHLLGIHHVRSGPNQLLWDLGFLAWGAVMLAGGAALLRGGVRAMARGASPQGVRSPTVRH